MLLSKTAIEQQAERVVDVIADGGVAIIPLDVAYGIVGNSEAAIHRIFMAKNRSFKKPSGMFSNWELFCDIQITKPRDKDAVRSIIFDHDLPFSTVAPYRVDHPMFAGLAPFVVEHSSRNGTIDMLLNAGDFHDEMTRLSMGRSLPVLGSSANTSLTGSKYRLQDIDAPVLAAADIALDGGLSKYHNAAGLSSTIVDLTTYQTVRIGICYEEICAILMDEFAIDLKANGLADAEVWRPV
jgi:tRNA A37 threonylcarbamoyladenosine synthetase subunit TsaC/SUA5/YrdC